MCLFHKRSILHNWNHIKYNKIADWFHKNSGHRKTISSNTRIIWFRVISFRKEPTELFQNYVSCLTSTIFNKMRTNSYWILAFKEKLKMEDVWWSFLSIFEDVLWTSLTLLFVLTLLLETVVALGYMKYEFWWKLFQKTYK